MKNLAVMTLLMLGTLHVSANSEVNEYDNPFEQSGILSSLQYAVIDGSLTEVERSSCALYPQVTPFAAATAGLHYKADQDEDCDDDFTSCRTYSVVNINYRYTVVKVIDYFNEAGKVVTSKTVKQPEGLTHMDLERSQGKWEHSDAGYLATDAAAKAQLTKLYGKANDGVVLQIRKNIFEGEEVCPNSFYK